MREKIRFKHDSLKVEDTYVSWIKQFILFNGRCQPAMMGVAEAWRVLAYQTIERHASIFTQNQALSAPVFVSLPPGHKAGRNRIGAIEWPRDEYIP